jgi:enoyl-[acyl-carrier protein] reductase II
VARPRIRCCRGVGDSRAYKAALALGSEGVQAGTRFFASTECIAHTNYKNIIVQSLETGTALVDFGRFRVRALQTPLVEKLARTDQMDAGLFGRKAMEDSWLKGDAAEGILPAGQIA